MLKQVFHSFALLYPDELIKGAFWKLMFEISKFKMLFILDYIEESEC